MRLERLSVIFGSLFYVKTCDDDDVDWTTICDIFTSNLKRFFEIWQNVKTN